MPHVLQAFTHRYTFRHNLYYGSYKWCCNKHRVYVSFQCMNISSLWIFTPLVKLRITQKLIFKVFRIFILSFIKTETLYTSNKYSSPPPNYRQCLFFRAFLVTAVLTSVSLSLIVPLICISSVIRDKTSIFKPSLFLFLAIEISAFFRFVLFLVFCFYLFLRQFFLSWN